MVEKIRVKFSGRDPTETWIRQFPGRQPYWGKCEFIFDPAVEAYDWLVVYNDLNHARLEERLPCPRSHTLLVTSEPSSIKCYGRAFTAQFGYVVTSQEPWALPHPGRIYSQPALQWFYGRNSEVCRDYDQMMAAPPLDKTRNIATVCSSKRQKHTLHNRRFEFVQQMRELLPDLDVYGHGVRPMHDKAESLDHYRYHIAIENHVGLHHWTEKLADPFLGVALPFYSGCPNASDYFPAESFIPINIDDPVATADTIRRSIEADEYLKRLPAILEARRLVLEKYNLFAVLSHEIEARYDSEAVHVLGESIFSRRELRKRHPVVALQDFLDKCRYRLFGSS